MYDDMTPKSVYRETGRWFGPVLVAGAAILVIGIALTFIGWSAGWWFTAHNATRQAQAIQNGYGNQSTLRAQVTAKLADVTAITAQIAATKDSGELAALKAQRMAVAGIACSDAEQVTTIPLPAQQARWVSANCLAGSVSPGSDLYVAGAP